MGSNWLSLTNMYLFAQIFAQNLQNFLELSKLPKDLKKMKISYSALDKAEAHVLFPPDQ